MDKHNGCGVTNEHQRSSGGHISPLKDLSGLHLEGKLHTSEVLLIASTQLVVKAENIYCNTTRSSFIKRLLETLLVVNKKCPGFTKVVIWMEHNLCIVASKPSQSNSLHVLWFKNSSALLNILKVDGIIREHS